MDVEKDIDYLAVEKMSKLRADSIEYIFKIGLSATRQYPRRLLPHI